MSIKISITNTDKTIKMNDYMSKMQCINLINEFEKYIIRNIDMKVFIYDENTTNFHQYEFEYKLNSKLNSKKWLLNNILYSIKCDKTQQNMSKLLKNLEYILMSVYLSC
jgi:hypothetical protein